MGEHVEENAKRVGEAAALLNTFSRDTGLLGDRPPRRYLWTDAHAVCALVELGRLSKDPLWISMAATLVDQVHDVLGRHRSDDERRGWISGLDDAAAARHPTAAGLRIGKPLPERGHDEPLDPRGEWDRDGQYYHYLTKWMHALLVMAAASGETRYRTWAVELAIAAHRGFRSRSGPPRLHWKMSTDLSRPLVPTSGLHDPLDGLVTALTLRARSTAHEPELDAAIDDLRRLCHGDAWATDDALGIGGLLFDAGRMAQLPEPLAPSTAFQVAVLRGALSGLQAFAASRLLSAPAERRLAFRELGLAIGLQALARMDPGARGEVIQLVDRLTPFRHLGDAIESFWRVREHRSNPLWREHGDINAAMLAVCLVPGAFLQI
jgi:hypothetical protein